MRGSRSHHPAAVNACAWADVDNKVGREHGLLVVLDYDNGIAEVAQALEGCYQLAVVALVQADARLVKNIEHPDQRRADLGCQADALGFAPRERPGLSGQREVIQTDTDKKAEPLADFLEYFAGNSRLGGG